MLAKPQCPLFCCRTLLNIISHIQPRRQLLPDICHGSLDVCLCMHQMAGPSMSVEHMWRCHGTGSKRSARVQRFGRRGSEWSTTLPHMQHARVEKGTDRNQPGMDRISNVPSWMGPCPPWITSWFPSKTVVSALNPQNIWSDFMLFRGEIPMKSPTYHGEIPVVTSGNHQPPGPPTTNGCPRPCCARIGAQAL